MIVATCAWLDGKIAAAPPVAGLAVFGLLAMWTSESSDERIAQCGAGVLFRLRRVSFRVARGCCNARGAAHPSRPAHLNHIFPPLALLLVLVPIFKLTELSFLVWPFVLLVDLLAIGLAAVTATLLPVLRVLLLTLAATGALIFKIPADLTGLPTSFFLLGAFAVFFVAVSLWLVRKISAGLIQDRPAIYRRPQRARSPRRVVAGEFGGAAISAADHGDLALAADQSHRRSLAWRCCSWCCCWACTKILLLDWMPARRTGCAHSQSNARGIFSALIFPIPAFLRPCRWPGI